MILTSLSPEFSLRHGISVVYSMCIKKPIVSRLIVYRAYLILNNGTFSKGRTR